MDWFQTEKGVCWGCILSPCLFNLYAEFIMWNAGQDEAQIGTKIAARNTSYLRYADVKVKLKLLSCVQLFATPWIVACTKLLHPWDFQGKSTGVGCHCLLQGIFPTQGSNPGLSHCRQTLYRICFLFHWFPLLIFLFLFTWRLICSFSRFLRLQFRSLWYG